MSRLLSNKVKIEKLIRINSFRNYNDDLYDCTLVSLGDEKL